MKKLSWVTCVFYFLVQSISANGQVYGCKDPAANNYNPSATVNDGSCTYGTTSYTPPVKVDPISNVLIESSGLQMAGGFLWSFNDGGGAAAIYRIDTTSNAILQTVNLGGATNKDWEDIAFDGAYFYIGDFGNNANGARTNLKIYKFPFSAIPSDYANNATVTISASQIEVINFTYSDQPQPPVAATSSNNTKFDCEAMIVDGGKIHLFSKNWVDANTTHYVINDTAAGTYVAANTETLPTGYLVTAADKAPTADVIVLLGYQSTGDHFLHLLSDYSGGFYFNGNKRQINLPSATEMGQAEGIAFRSNSYGYISNEKLFTINQKLRSFNTESFVPGYVLPIRLQHFSAVTKNGANEISWRFAEAVNGLRLQQSSNGAAFVTLQTFPSSSDGNFLHRPAAGTTCYRLVWKEANGADRYSNVACVKNGSAHSFSKVVLRSNGELAFDFADAVPTGFSFWLLTTDGRVLAQTTTQTLATGGNKIHFFKNVTRGAVFVLEAVGSDEKMSMLLKVE